MLIDSDMDRKIINHLMNLTDYYKYYSPDNRNHIQREKDIIVELMFEVYPFTKNENYLGMTNIKPQPVQEKALKCKSKIVLLGGAKGGGKSFAIRLAPLYNVHLEGYHAVIFRRTLAQCKKPGGLWDKSYDIYPYLGGVDRVSELKWVFPFGGTIQFSHLQRDNSFRDWFGTETAFFGFDQLEEFTQEHFLNILGCMRTTCGCETQLMATLNPDSGSWVRKLVDPWIADDGYVDPNKNNQEYYFTIKDNKIKWLDHKDEAHNPISCTYISADIWDNSALLESDPNYLINLQSQSKFDRERFLGLKGRGGNWNIKAEAGKIFRYDWFKTFQGYKYQEGDKAVRFWDFAMTIKETKDSDFIADCLMIKRGDRYFVLEVGRRKLPPVEIDDLVYRTAIADQRKYLDYYIRWQKDPASAGVKETVYLRRKLINFDANGLNIRDSKLSRALPLSREVEIGGVQFLESAWNDDLFIEMEVFPDGLHDDMVDAVTGAYYYLSQGKNITVNDYSF